MVRKGHKNKGMIEENLLSLSYGHIVKKDIGTTDGLLPESFETYQIVDPGNIIMRLTDLQNDKRSLRQGLVRQRGIITSAYDALQVYEVHEPRYWAYILLSLDLAKYYYSLGGGVRQSIKFADFSNEWITYPDLPIQKAIADFLDRETARIDQLIEKKQRIVEVLGEKIRATIKWIVFGQDKPGAKKENRVPWLPDLPEYWNILRISHLFRNLDSKRVPLNKVDRADLEKTYPYYGASGQIDFVDRYIFDEDLILGRGSHISRRRWCQLGHAINAYRIHRKGEILGQQPRSYSEAQRRPA